jgi:methanethiol S-methyltransferase
MKRFLILTFGVVSYAVFFGTFLYLIAFVGNLQQVLAGVAPWLQSLVPHSIDVGRATGPVGLAVAINLGLMLLFGMQHSVMARTGFKAWLTRKLPASAERSFYVLLASLVLIFLFWHWRPIPRVVWAVESATGQAVMWSIFGLGFGLVLITTFLIDHFDLFGLRQVWSQFVGRPLRQPAFGTPLFYRFVRHPLYLGFFLAFWATPVMTLGHLLFAVTMSGYMLVAIQLEERDLVRHHGWRYARYREQVPMLVPRPGRRFAEEREVV